MVTVTGLTASGVGVRYGGVVALDGVEIGVPCGEVVGLIGPNGAGKTTFIDAVTGFVRCTGAIHLIGEDITTWAPHQRVRAGLSRTFQTVDLFDELTILENLAVVMAGRDPDRLPAQPADILEQFGLTDDADRYPDELSNGRRRLAGLARSLMARPRVLLLDEPAAGLDSNETTELVAPLRRLAADAGIGILLVDHDVDFIAGTCSSTYALDFGRIIASGPTAAVLDSPQVHAAYLGDLEWHEDGAGVRA